MRVARHILRTLAWLCGGLLGLIALLGGSLMVIGNTAGGQRLLAGLTRSLTDGQVQLQGLSGRFPDRLSVRTLLLSDPRGPWLRADHVHLDWSPLALLQDRIRIRVIDAAEASMLRRPGYGAAAAAGAASARRGFPLPLALQIDQLRLPRVFLGAALAGSDVNLRLQGAVSYRSLERAALQLSVQRLDAVPATYLVTADLRPRQLAVQMDLEEQADGPLANLLQLPGLGALSVHLLMEGPRTAVRTRLDAQAGALTASANGTLDLPRRAAQLSLSVQAGAMAPRAGLSWQQVSLQAQAHGALIAPTTSATLTLAGLRYRALQLGRLQAQLQGVGRGLSLQAQLAGLALPAPLGSLLSRSPISVSGQLRPAGGSLLAVDLSVSHPMLQAMGQLALDFSHRRRSGTELANVTATLPDLASWSALTRLRLPGRASLQGSLREMPAGLQLSLSAALTIGAGSRPWSALLGPRSTLEARALLGRGAEQLQQLELSGPHLSLSASGEERGGVLDVGWRLARADLAALEPAVAGQLHATGRVQGTLPRLSLSASADAGVQFHQASGKLRASVQAADLPERARGRVRVDGTLDGAPVMLQASLQREGTGALGLQIAQGRWKSAQLSGNLRIDGDVRAPQGQLQLTVPRVADLDPLLGDALRGQLSAQLQLQGSAARNRALLTLNAQDLALAAVDLHSLQLHGSIEQPLRSPRAELSLATQGTLGGLASSLSASASGAPEHLMLTTHVQIGGGVQTATQLEAQAVWLGARRQLQLNALEAHYREQRLRLLSSATVSFSDGVSVSRLRLGVPPAIVQLQGQITPRLALRATVRRLSPAALGIFLPEFRGLQPRGEASADATLEGTLANPSGSFMLSATGLHSAGAGVSGLPPASLNVDARLQARVTTVQLAIEAGPQMRLHASGELPLDRGRPMALQVAGNVDLAFANPVLEARGQRALGELSLQLQVGGSLGAPQVRGQMALHKAELQDLARGLRLSGIEATLTAQGSQLTLTHFAAQAGSGTVGASGTIDVGAPHIPVQLSITAQHAQALRSDLLTADVDMALHLTGQLQPQHLAAAGSVRVNKATINIPNALPPSVAVLHVVKPGQQAAPPPPPTPLLSMLDLAINAPTGIFVRGRGLAVQVGGTLHVTGSSSAPNVTGGFDLINGTFDMAGTTLNFSSGRVSFTGSGLRNRMVPSLNFVASSYSGGITATLTVTGYADAPVISLSSTPPLPQDEILARLLFGESVAQLTPLQIAGIGTALVSVSGVGGGGFNPLNTVQQALGLNRLVISSGTGSTGSTAAGGAAAQNNSGATIEAGRYISNRLYVGARQSTTGTTQAQVQIDLTRNWKLQTTISSGGGPVQGVVTPQNDPGSSIGMSYQFEY